jgi:mRNA-degrading endonuclease RelE of RelBE toxin-antitoxin system
MQKYPHERRNCQAKQSVKLVGLVMKVSVHPIAGKYLERLNEVDKDRIKSALKGLEKEPPEGNIIPITGLAGHYRLKIGSYRALFRYKDNSIYITHIEPRGQVYNKKNKRSKR